MARLSVLLWMALFHAQMQAANLPGGDWKTDLSKRSIDLSELRSGGPPKDGIPAVDDPKFESPAEASTWLSPKEPVLLVEYGGEARAYPLQILIFHELVNDQIGDLPLLASFCPLCHSAIAFDRRIDGKLYDFGVSGLLRMSDMVMYDRQTESLWQQLTGGAIVGALTGKQLEIVTSQVIPFNAFAESFPGGKVLSRDTGHQRPYGMTPYGGYEFGKGPMFPVNQPRRFNLDPLDRLVTITIDGKTKAYPLDMLKRKTVEDGRMKKTHYVIFYEPTTLSTLDAQKIAESKAVGAVGVFSPELDEQRLEFREKDGKIIDKKTGSAWNLLGVATEGPLKGKRLEPIEHGVFYAFAWIAFHPDTQVVGAPLVADPGGFPGAEAGPAGGSPTLGQIP